MDWYLIRPGVRLSGHWTPDLFSYPFRYEGPKIGDPVWVIIRDRDTKEFRVAEDTIGDITDYSEGRPGDKQGYLIDYWLDTYNPGHGVTYGDVLFESEDDAKTVLDQIVANIEKWDI